MSRNKNRNNNKKSNASTAKVIITKAPPDNWINPSIPLATANDLCKGRQTDR